jgi:hypothetical protein
VDSWKRTLTESMKTSKTMTVGKCEAICVKAGTKYYGLEVRVVDFRTCKSARFAIFQELKYFLENNNQ